MDPSNLVASVATSVQIAAALLLAGTLAYLARLFGSRYAALWALGWASLAVALGAARLELARGGRAGWAVLLVGQWCFLVCLAGGSSDLARRTRFPWRWLAWGLLPAALVAGVAARAAPTFDALFARQALAVALAACYAAYALGAVPRADRHAGVLVLRIVLVATAVLFASYVPLFTFHARLPYAPVADTVVVVLLGFAMLLALAGETKGHLERAVGDLRRAREEMVRVARLDPLTEVFNRHAFHSLLTGSSRAHGAVILVDVNDLQRIADSDGKAAADFCVRAAATAIRRLIRPEDLMFRWGGDEFLVLLPNIPLATAEQRFAALGDGVHVEASERGPARRLPVSWGIAPFGDGVTLAQCITAATVALDRHRLSRAPEAPPLDEKRDTRPS